MFDLIFYFYSAHVFCGDYLDSGLADMYFTIGSYDISFAEWLCATASIITMVAILLFCVFIIKKIIGIIFRLFTGSSAF